MTRNKWTMKSRWALKLVEKKQKRYVPETHSLIFVLSIFKVIKQIAGSRILIFIFP